MIRLSTVSLCHLIDERKTTHEENTYIVILNTAQCWGDRGDSPCWVLLAAALGKGPVHTHDHSVVPLVGLQGQLLLGL